MKKFIVVIVLVFVVAVAGLCGGYHYALSTIKPVETVRIDTVFYNNPEPRAVINRYYVTRWLPSIRIPVVVDEDPDGSVQPETGVTVEEASDSAQVLIPIETKVYFEEDEYYAEVTGFEPSLSYIEVYPKTVTQYIEVPVRRRFSFGPTAMWGVGPNGTGWMIGIGATWNILP